MVKKNTVNIRDFIGGLRFFCSWYANERQIQKETLIVPKPTEYFPKPQKNEENVLSIY